MSPRINKSIITKHFTINEDFAVCNICKSQLKKDRFFNLKAHLAKVHKINISDVCDIDNSSTSSGPIKTQFRKQIVKIEISKKQLFRSYIGLVTENGISFNILDSENMKNIINPICRGLSEKLQKKFQLNSSNCKQVLSDVAAEIREGIKKELKLRLISLKIDSATRLSRNIFGISAQFIDNSKIQSRILGMVELKGTLSSSSRNLATEIINTLTKFDINLNQLVSITSDNGANMLKTTKILSHCTTMEEIGEDGDVEVANDVYLRNIELFEDQANNIQLGDIQICRCAAHTAQLCALDVTKDAIIKNNLMTCRNLVKYIKKNSNGYRDIFELKKLILPQLDCPTRWGSTYNLLKNINHAKEVLQNIESIKNKSNEENFEINDDLWLFVESYCTIFEPLQSTIVKFQEEQLHYGNFFAQWLKCKLMTEKIITNNQNNVVLHEIGTKLLKSIEVRTAKLLKNESLNACLYLDPRFNHTLTIERKASAISFLKKLYDRMKAMGSISTTNRSTMAHQYSSTNDNNVHNDDDDINEYLSQHFTPQTHADSDIYTKIENVKLPFLRVGVNVLEFWKEREFADPDLYALSNICFAIPPTQVTIERAFSALKLVLTDNRNRLSHELLENILLVKLNPSFLDRAINELSLFENSSDENDIAQ